MSADRSNQTQSRPSIGHDGRGNERAKPHGDGHSGGDTGREAVRQSREAAGLVSSKTTPNETNNTEGFHWGNGPVTIQFDKRKNAEKRVKRLKRNVWASATLHQMSEKGHRAPQCWFVTLTYAKCDGWQPSHVMRACDAFRRWCKRKGVPCRYTWVAELQNRGAVHYHLLVWLPQGVRMPHWDRATRSACGRTVNPFWSHGMTNTERAKAGVGYLMKYLSKLGELTVFPDGLRLYGVAGLSDQARNVRAWYNLPEWVKAEYGVAEVRRVNGHLTVMETGEILPPMFHRQFVPGGMVLTLLRPYPERVHTGAYSTYPRK